MAATLLVLAACGDDSGSSASTGGAGTSVASSGGSGDTSGGASGSSDSGSGGGSNTTGAVTTEATTTTTINPTVPDSQAITSLVQTAVQMKFLAAALAKGQATPDAYQKVFADWDVYDGTIQKKNPQAWQTHDRRAHGDAERGDGQGRCRCERRCVRVRGGVERLPRLRLTTRSRRTTSGC